MTKRTQKHEGPTADKPFEGWTALEVNERDPSGLPEWRLRLSLTKWNSLDLALECYVGISRRAKYQSARLQEPAARALYEQLRARFEPPIATTEPQP